MFQTNLSTGAKVSVRYQCLPLSVLASKVVRLPSEVDSVMILRAKRACRKVCLLRLLDPFWRELR